MHSAEAALDFKQDYGYAPLSSGGLGNAEKLLGAIRRGDASYDFVKVMAYQRLCRRWRITDL